MSGVLVELEVETIKVKEQPRKDFSAVESLAQSISQHGLLVPILVHKENGGYTIIDGEQRLRAVKSLKKPTIRALVAENMDEQARKEAQMVANLYRSDLTFWEKCLGFARLLDNCPAKYNERTVAVHFNVKEKQVRAMAVLVRKIHPELYALIPSDWGQMEIEFFGGIAKDYQERVLEQCRKKRQEPSYSLQELAHELYFDDVFNKEKARAAGKIHAEVWSRCYTFDKEFAEKVKKEFEDRRKTSYEKAKEGAKKGSEKQVEMTAEKKKKLREKKAADLTTIYKEVRREIPGFIGKKPSRQTLDYVVDYFSRKIYTDDHKMLLRAWEVPFKAGEMSSEEIRELSVEKILRPLIKDERTALRFIELVNIPHQASTVNATDGLKQWLRGMRK